MHGEFPCKFFHTNTECYAGEKCRFSHAPLTEETRAILRNYLDSGTLPDDPKPFRPHFSNDWSNSSTSKTDDLNDVDSSEFDSSFNYETERKRTLEFFYILSIKHFLMFQSFYLNHVL